MVIEKTTVLHSPYWEPFPSAGRDQGRILDANDDSILFVRGKGWAKFHPTAHSPVDVLFIERDLTTLLEGKHLEPTEQWLDIERNKQVKEAKETHDIGKLPTDIVNALYERGNEYFGERFGFTMSEIVQEYWTRDETQDNPEKDS